MDQRFEEALEKAKDAFYNSLAASYPEITTGDLEPLMVNEFDNVARGIAENWVDFNIDNKL